MKINAKRKQPIKIKDTNLEEVEEFTYLGSIVNIEGGTDADVKNRINKVRVHLQHSRESMECQEHLKRHKDENL